MNRRDFLKTLSGAVAMLGLSPTRFLSSFGSSDFYTLSTDTGEFLTQENFLAAMEELAKYHSEPTRLILHPDLRDQILNILDPEPVSYPLPTNAFSIHENTFVNKDHIVIFKG